MLKFYGQISLTLQICQELVLVLLQTIPVPSSTSTRPSQAAQVEAEVELETQPTSLSPSEYISRNSQLYNKRQIQEMFLICYHIVYFGYCRLDYMNHDIIEKEAIGTKTDLIRYEVYKSGFICLTQACSAQLHGTGNCNFSFIIIFHLKIVYQYGGIYCDTDCVR